MAEQKMTMDLFGHKNIKVIAGDIPPGDYTFDYGSLINKDYPTDPKRNFELSHSTKSVTLQNETEAKNWLVSSGFAAAGAIFGPVGIVIGFMLGGSHRIDCAIVELKDGRKFMAVSNQKNMETIQAYAAVG